jgi:ankyrin repeat protein
MPLADAVQAGDVLAIRESLSRGEDPNQTLGDRTLLTWAVEFAGIPIIRALLEGGASAAKRDPGGADALDRATAAQRRNVLWALASHYPPKRLAAADQSLPYAPVAAPQPQPRGGKKKFEHPFIKQSALNKQLPHATPQETALVQAAEKGRDKEVLRLLREGVNPNAVGKAELCASTPLWAAVNNRKHAAIGALANAGANLDDPLPEPPLFDAVQHHGVDMVRALAHGGADLAITTFDGQTPLQMAINRGRPGTFNELMRLGVDPNQQAAPTHATKSRQSPLQIAASAGTKEMFDALLAAGAGDAKLSALRLTVAAKTGQLDEVKSVVAGGAGVNDRDSLHRTPLVAAVLAGQTAIAKFLLQQGAAVNNPQGMGQTAVLPIHAAVEANNLPLAKLLVEAGANIKRRDGRKQTALELARALRCKKIVDYLTDALVGEGVSPPPIGTKLRGVTTFDLNDACLLIEAPVEDTAAKFKQLIGATVWKKDVFDKTVKLSQRSYAVVRLVGVPWTAIVCLCAPTFPQYPSASEAQSLSKSLKVRTIHLANSDTGGIAQYALYDCGKIVEFFGHGLDEFDEERSQIERHFDVGLGDLPAVETYENITFSSLLRKVKVKTIKNGLDFINDFLVAQDALAPMFDASGAPGKPFKLEFEEFGEGEVERLDFLGARSKKA